MIDADTVLCIPRNDVAVGRNVKVIVEEEAATNDVVVGTVLHMDAVATVGQFSLPRSRQTDDIPRDLFAWA